MASTPEETSPYSMATADSDEETILQFTSSVYLRIRNSKTSLIDLNDTSSSRRPPSIASSVCGSVRSTRYDTITENPTDEQPQLSTDDQLLLPTDEHPQLSTDEVFKPTEGEVPTYPFSDSGVSSLEEVFVRDPEDRTEDTETEVEKDPNQVEKKKVLLDDIRALGQLGREDSSSESTLSIDESDREEEDTPVHSTEDSATEENVTESDPVKLDTELTVQASVQESSTSQLQEETIPEPVSASSSSSFAREEEEESEEGMSTKQAAQTHDARTSVLEDIRKIGEKRSPDIIDDQLQSKKSKPSYTSSESDDSLRKPPGYTPAVSATPAEEVQSSLPPGGANPPVREPQAGSHIPQSVLAGGKPKGEPTKPRGVQEGNVKKKASFFRKKGQSDEELSRQPSPPPKIRTSGPGVMDRIKTFFGRERTSYDLQQAQTDVGIKYGTSHTLPDEPRERKPLLELQEEAPKLRKADVTVVEDEENSLPTPTVVRSHQANSREPGTSSSSGAENLKGSLKKAAVPEVKAAPAPAINASAAGPTAALPTKEAKLERKTSSSSLTSASSLDLPKKKKLKKKERKSSTSSKSSVSSLSSVDDRKTGPMNMDAEDSNLPPSRVVGSKPSSLKMKTSPVLESTPPLEVQKPPSPVVNTAPPMATKKTPSPEVKASPPVEVQKAPPPVQKAPPPVKKASPMVQKTPPSVKKTPPPVKKTPPPVKKTPPLVQKTSPPVVKASPAVEVQRPPSPVKKTTPFDEVRAPFLAAFFSFRQSAHAFSSKKRYTVEKALAKRAWSVEKVDAPWPSQAKSFSPVEKVSTPFSPMNASPPILSSSSLPVQRPAARPAQLKKTPESPRVREPVSPVYVVEPAEPVKTTPPPVLPQANQVTQVETQSPAPPVNNSVSLQTARSPTEIEGARQSVLGNIKQLRKDSSSSSSSSSDSEEEVAPTTEAPAATPVFPTEATPTVVEEVRSAPPPVMEAPKDKSTFEKIKDKADDMFSKKTTLKAKRIEGREIDDVDQIKEILKNKKGAKIIIVSEDELTSSSSSSSDDEYEKPASPMPEQVAVATADEAHSAPPPSKLLNGEPETSGKVIVSGSGLGHVPVHRTAKFMVSAENVEELPMEIIVTGPRKDRLPCRYNDANGSIQVEYVPEEVGEHDISVKYNGTEVPGGPFVCHAYDITKIKVSEAKWDVGKDVEVPIDTSRVGQGNLSASVTKDGRDIGSKLIDQGDGKQMLSFNPEGVGLYNIGLTFNKTNVPVRCPVIDPNQVAVRGEGYRRGHYLPVGETVSFNVDTTESGDAPVVATVTDSVDRDVPCDVYKDGSIYTATYTPKEPGDHKVNVKFAGLTVASSPVTVHAYDVNRVSLGPLSKRDELGYVSTIVDTKKAGSGILNTSVTTKDETVPHNCDKLDTGKYKVSFQPKRLGQYEVHAEYNDVTVPGSPLVYENFDTSDIVVGGEGLGNVPVGKLAKFQVDASKTPGGDVVVKIAGPRKGADYAGSVTPSDQDKVTNVEYLPSDVGQYDFLVLFDGEPVKQKPFVSHAYDASAVAVNAQERGKIGKEVCHKVDTTNAGQGVLKAVVAAGGQDVPSKLSSAGEGLYDLTFTPKNSAAHLTTFSFNDEMVKGSPFTTVLSTPEDIVVMGAGIGDQKCIPVNKEAIMKIDATKAGDEEVVVKVAGPTERDFPCEMNAEDQIYSVNFMPVDVGDHKFMVKYGEEEVKESPFIAHAFDPSKVEVQSVPKAKLGQQVSLKIDGRNAGKAELTGEISKDGDKVPSELWKADDGRHLMTFLANELGTYNAHIRHGGFPVEGSPFPCKVYNMDAVDVHGDGVSETLPLPVNEKTTFYMETKGPGNVEDALVKVSDPTGKDVPANITAHNGIYHVDYTPREIGQHKVRVHYDEKEVSGSPYTVNVFDANRIRADPDRTATVNQPVNIKVDARDAGPGKLTYSVDPDVPDVMTEPSRDQYLVQYTPTQPGSYSVDMKYNNKPVPGTPFVCDVQAEPQIGVAGSGLLRGYVDEKATFDINAQNCKLEELGVRISNSKGFVPHEVDSQGDQHKVIYTPRDAGPHTVDIVYFGKHVEGSPFYPNISAPGNVQILGKPGEMVADRRKLPLTVDRTCNVELDASTAGPGTFKSVVRGPSGEIQSSVTDVGNDRHNLKFTPLEKGDHEISVLYAGRDIKHSPFRADVQEPDIVQAIDDQPVQQSMPPPVRAPSLASQPPRSPSQSSRPVEAPSPIPQPALVPEPAQVSPPEQVAQPAQVPPQAQVSPPEQVAQPAQVPQPKQVATEPVGDVILKGLPEYANAKTPFRVHVDTRPAPGGGTLASRCFGPSKSSDVQLYDFENGTYELKVTPKEKGRHTLEVVYDQKHAPGSPHVFEVGSKSDYKRVKVFGPGLNNGMINYYRGNFLCDTRGAGEGDLSVRIQGPKGAFKVRMNPLAENERVIAVSYDPTFPGNYDITVKWSDKHVPGSPFRVYLAPPSSEPMGQPEIPPMMQQSIPRSRGSSRY
ncbi:PREDICTED: filamin-A-like isoform X5 [Branchiostoma belcheri]|uniref:Filamin-A-like isoform X5 n=1 Tax=Branchiostoma belcheri TaxID=7741 RepID=A0A6P4ZDK1_BRABE|nr:PREDICTED: filamin-A-like isoform X5 [Branchiostoma belcheri]